MSKEIVRTVDCRFFLTAHELAEAFWEMSSVGQAEFFNRLEEISEHRLCFQLQAVTDEPGLNANGRYAMALIGEYSR